MRGVSKKMLISILTSVIVFVTMVATTFAWVGIFTYANTEAFNLNLKVSELDSNYYLTISSTGIPGTFSNEVPSIELKRQIVNSIYDNRYKDDSNEIVEKIFNKTSMESCTTLINDDMSFSPFKSIDFKSGNDWKYKETKNYYKFDLFLSVNTKEGINQNTTGIKSNVYLTDLEEMLTGTICQGNYINNNPYIDLPSDSIYSALKSVPTYFKMNSKNAYRIGMSLYSPIAIDDNYSDQKPIKSIIFESGKELPFYDETMDVYDLGGCIPKEYNSAIDQLLITHSYLYDYNINNKELFDTTLNQAINRNDLEINESNSKIWNKSEHLNDYLGCMDGLLTKMKITIYLWCEGWDADCLKGINMQPVTLNLSFTSGTDD